MMPSLCKLSWFKINPHPHTPRPSSFSVTASVVSYSYYDCIGFKQEEEEEEGEEGEEEIIWASSSAMVG